MTYLFRSKDTGQAVGAWPVRPHRRMMALICAAGLAVPLALLGGAVPAFADTPDTIVDGCTIVANPTISSYTDCHAMDLSGADLDGIDLSHANLTGANLTGAKLRGTNLTNANLRDANLSDAELFGANLSTARMNSANLSGATLDSARLVGAVLYDADLTGADLTGANLAYANLAYANLAGAYVFDPTGKRHVLLIPADVETTAVGADPVTVSWETAPQASNSLSNATDTCAPAPGSSFPVGVTTVTCTVAPYDDGTYIPGYMPAPGTGSFTVAVNQAPANTDMPRLTGTATAGLELTCSPGAWTGYPTPTYQYTFLRGTTMVQAASATATYPLTTTDQGADMSCVVTATNTTGTESASSEGVSIPRGSQAITFTSTPPTAATVGDIYTPVADATSLLPVSFTIDASSTAVCSLSSGNVSFIGIGECVIDANQAGDATFAPADQVQQAVTVKAAQSAAPSATSLTKTYRHRFSRNPATFTATVTSNGHPMARGTVTFTATKIRSWFRFFRAGQGTNQTVTLCAAVPIGSAGTARCNRDPHGFLTAYTITATYSGDTDVAASGDSTRYFSLF